MQMVPYAPRPNKRARFGSYDSGSSYSPMQIVPYQRSSAIASSYKAGLGVRTSYPTRNSRRRSKWSIMNQRTNPVYPRPEVKYFDVQIGVIAGAVPIANNGTTIVSLNTIVQGLLSQNRIGGQVATKSVYYQYVVSLPTGDTTTAVAVRHMLVWDRQSNGANPVAADFLQNPGSVGFVVSPLNLANRDRFVVLVDERLTMSPGSDIIKLCSGFRYINQQSTFGNSAIPPTTGGLFAFFVSDEPAGATAPNLYGNWRVRFIDN